METEWIATNKAKGSHWIFPEEFRSKSSKTYGLLQELSPLERTRLVHLMIETAVEVKNKQAEKDFPDLTLCAIYRLLEFALAGQTELTPDDISGLFDFYRRAEQEVYEYASFYYWPLTETARQAKKIANCRPLTPAEYSVIRELSKWEQFDFGFSDEPHRKFEFIDEQHGARCELIDALASDPADRCDLPEIRFLPSLRLGGHISEQLAETDSKSRDRWTGFLHDALRLDLPKPTKSLTATLNAWVDVIGGALFRKSAHRWLNFAAELENSDHPASWSNDYREWLYLPAPDERIAHALVVALERFSDTATLNAIASLASRCFEKIPGSGPAAQSLGNACIRQLAAKRSLDGITHLSRLKLRVPQANTKAFIQRRLEEAAEKRGLTAQEIEESAAPDFGLVEGQRDLSIGDHTFRIAVGPDGKAATSWIKPDGGPQKSIPATVKNSAKLRNRHNEAKETAKQIRQNWGVQRDRIDRLFVEEASWPLDRHKELYLDHGLVGTIGRSLIWTISDAGGLEAAALWSADGWQDVGGRPVTPAKNAAVSLWHPIDAGVDEVLAWRARLEALEIRQPFKQAYREVYLLTDAERHTRTYSNRMAAHLVRQSQFNRLAQGRGWQNKLLLCFDGAGENGLARRTLAAHDLVAEFLIDEVDFPGQGHSDNGVWNYVGTDQLRFHRPSEEPETPVDLEDIPPLVFSEVMRDLDLFVGVASVGNDPTWGQRGDAGAYRDYWNDYSFGDLSEIAKTRRGVLEKLLPRLKIRDRAHVDGNFLIVDGHRHTYRIHIGSTNILIAPESKYLCILPDRNRSGPTDTISLPFEGDAQLSNLISKAFLLADDDKITDETILSQL